METGRLPEGRARTSTVDRYIRGRAARDWSRRLALIRESDIEGSHRSHGGYPQKQLLGPRTTRVVALPGKN